MSMSKCDKLLEKAKNSTNNFSFSDVCYLAECYGYEFERQSGSHNIYRNPHSDFAQFQFMNFQNVKGKSKPYQIRQLLRAIILSEDEK